jgi:class 3 adenylate cyclase
MNDDNLQSAPTVSNAELRLATVLKCDIVDSTRTWTGLDLSDGLKLTRAFRRTVSEVAERHGGQVFNWQGDGAVVLFGVPTAREDAPETAVRAGLQLVTAIRSIRVADVSIDIRVGISSGRIAVDLTDKSMEGLDFNIAERLQASGQPGWVLVTEGTKRLAKNFFEYDDLGLLKAKGFEQGLQAWRVLREVDVTSRFEAQRFDKTHDVIVGRDKELAQLANAWSAAKNGQGQAVVLIGDPGLGKSRLAKACLDMASRDGGKTLEIDCMPSMGNSPLFPVSVLLGRLAGIHHTATEAEKIDCAKTLIARFFAEDERQSALEYLSPLFKLQVAEQPRNSAPEEVRKQTIRMLVDLVGKLAKRGPLAILCEDGHWADDTTATVMQDLAESIVDLPVMLIVTARSEPDAPSGARKIEKPSLLIRLEPLPVTAAADLVRSIATGVPLAPDLLEEIVEQSDGIPLLLEEVTRGILENPDRIETIDFSSTPRGVVPVPLQLIVESRLERWQRQKPLIQAASVLGREFSTDVLAQLFSNRQSDTANDIEMLAERGWFVKQGADTGDPLRFRHALIRDAVNQTLMRDDRRALHSQVADILYNEYQKRPDSTPETLAHHLYQATRFEESIEIRLAASGDTLARGAYVEAEGHCDAALKIIDSVGDAARRRELHFKVLAQLGVALTGRHGYSAPQVEQTYRLARTVCGEKAEAEALYPIMRGLTALNLVRGNLPAGNDLSLQSMAIAEQSNRAAFQIDAMSVHCYATLYYASLRECRRAIDQCLDAYHKHGGEALKYPVPNDAKTAALAILPTVEWLLGNSQAAEEAIEEGLAHVERSDRNFDKAYMHAWIAGVRMTQRRNTDARKHAKIAFDIGSRNGFREWQVTGLLIDLISRAIDDKDYEALKSATETCMALAAEGVGLNASWYLWGLARGYRAIGQMPVAQQLIEQAFQRAQASQETRMNAELLILKAELEADPTAAVALLEDALKLSDSQGAVANSLRAAAALVMRSKRGGSALELARETHQILEGQRGYPAEQGWMNARLATLNSALSLTQA